MNDSNLTLACPGYGKAATTDEVYAKARKEIEQAGWKIDENIQNNKCHLVLIKGDQRKGFGLFDRIYAWTEAYEFITGKPWVSLI